MSTLEPINLEVADRSASHDYEASVYFEREPPAVLKPPGRMSTSLNMVAMVDRDFEVWTTDLQQGKYHLRITDHANAGKHIARMVRYPDPRVLRHEQKIQIDMLEISEYVSQRIDEAEKHGFYERDDFDVPSRNELEQRRIRHMLGIECAKSSSNIEPHPDWSPYPTGL